MTDFAPGDVVVCVDDSPSQSFPYPGAPWPLRRGWMGRISETCVGPDWESYLRFGDTPDAWLHSRFRKLKAADEQFTEQMRALRPAKVPATLSRSSENGNG